ncbi:MAG TPA: M14 family metallopeptidase [Leptolinea sp.]
MSRNGFPFQKNPKVIPADRTLYILRLLNPDGEARGHNLDGRTNERGVDLNRNWDAFWVVDWPRDGCWNYRPISAGSGPFSEPETIALRDFIKKHKISALVNYHSAALGIFAGGNPPEAESIRLAKSIAAVTDYAYPATSTGCKYTGQFADWLASNGTAAVDLELTNHTDTDFEANKKVLTVLMKWEPSTGPKSLSGLINMAQSVPEKPTLIEQIRKFGVQTANEVNGLVFGKQEEK